MTQTRNQSRPSSGLPALKVREEIPRLQFDAFQIPEPPKHLLSSIIYKRSNDDYGRVDHNNPMNCRRFPLTGKFSTYVSIGGPVKREGFNTSNSHANRVHNRQNDWLNSNA